MLPIHLFRQNKELILAGLKKKNFKDTDLVDTILNIDEQRRAIGADALVRRAHVDVNMRMIEGRQRADAHEFLRADAHRRDAGLIVEMGRGMFGHRSLPFRFIEAPRGRFGISPLPILQRDRIG